jgi:hypothetical protein
LSDKYRLPNMKRYAIKIKDNLTAINYNGMAAKYDRVMFFLHKDSITRVVVLKHTEYLDKLKRQDKASWLVILKTCV